MPRSSKIWSIRDIWHISYDCIKNIYTCHMSHIMWWVCIYTYIYITLLQKNKKYIIDIRMFVWHLASGYATYIVALCSCSPFCSPILFLAGEPHSLPTPPTDIKWSTYIDSLEIPCFNCDLEMPVQNLYTMNTCHRNHTTSSKIGKPGNLERSKTIKQSFGWPSADFGWDFFHAIHFMKVPTEKNPSRRAMPTQSPRLLCTLDLEDPLCVFVELSQNLPVAFLNVLRCFE